MDDIEILYTKLKEQNKASTRRLKARIEPPAFTKYLFIERKRIVEWNRSAGLIRFGIFGFIPKTVKDFRTRLYGVYLKEIHPLYALANRGLDEGWQWQLFSVKEYNILVFFSDFCKKVQSYGESRTAATDAFAVAEEAYFKLTYSAGMVELLEKAFRKIFLSKKTGGTTDKAQAEKTLIKLREFLTAGDGDRSFLSFSLAFNMAVSRKYLSSGDLTRPYAGELLPDRFYSCSMEVFRKVLGYYRSLKKEIGSLRNALNQLEWLEKQSRLADEDKPEELIKAYDTDINSWAFDRKNYYELFLRLMKRTLERLEGVLRLEWQLMSTEEKMVNARIVNDKHLEALYEELAGRYAMAEGYFWTNAPIAVSLLEFKDDSIPYSILETNVHKVLQTKFNEMLADLFQISVGLEELTIDRNYPRAFMLRFMIVQPIEYRGKSVSDVLSDTIGTLLKICSYFGCPVLSAQLNKTSQVRRELSVKVKEREYIDSNRVLEGLLPGEEYQEKQDAV